MNPSIFPTQIETGGFGKLPAMPEFIRVRAGTRELVALDQFIQEGLYNLRQEVGQDWKGLYDTFLFHRFLFRADNCGQTVIGVIRAAMDVLERRFPFVVFGLLPTKLLDTYPILVPSVLEELYGALEQTIEDVKLLANPEAVRRRLEIPIPFPLPTSVMEGRYHSFLNDVLCCELGVRGEEESLGMVNHIVATLSRLKSPRRVPVSFEFPLAQPPFGRGLEIRFWIELCLTLMDWYPPSLSLFWHAGIPRPQTSSLVMSLRHPPGHLMTGLLVKNEPVRGIWRPELHQSLSAASGFPTINVVARADDTLGSLLQSVWPGYPGSCRWFRPVESI